MWSWREFTLFLLNPNWQELWKQEKCSAFAPPRGNFHKTQWAWQDDKLTWLMSIFTSKKVWTFLIKIQLTKSDPKRTGVESALHHANRGQDCSAGFSSFHSRFIVLEETKICKWIKKTKICKWINNLSRQSMIHELISPDGLFDLSVGQIFPLL